MPFFNLLQESKTLLTSMGQMSGFKFLHIEFSKLGRIGSKPELQTQTPKLGGSFGWNISFAAGL